MCLIEQSLRLKPNERLEYFLGQSLASARVLIDARGREIDRVAKAVYRLATTPRGKEPPAFALVQKKLVGGMYSHIIIRL
jgi:hypothetical protein